MIFTFLLIQINILFRASVHGEQINVLYFQEHNHFCTAYCHVHFSSFDLAILAKHFLLFLSSYDVFMCSLFLTTLWNIFWNIADSYISLILRYKYFLDAYILSEFLNPNFFFSWRLIYCVQIFFLFFVCKYILWLSIVLF